MLPVVLVTGSLGAGKTTALNHALADMGGDARIAIVENEAGVADIDGTLLAASGQWVLSLVGGCVCCTLVPELVDMLGQLVAQSDRFEAIIIEASGVADPHAMLAAFQAAPVRGRLRVEQVVTVVDVTLDPAHAPDPWLWDRQVALADTIVLARDGERVPTEARQLVDDRVRLLNPAARRIQMRSLQSEHLLCRPSASARQPVLSVDGEEARGAGFASVAIDVGGPLVRSALVDTLNALVTADVVVRAKGFLQLEGTRGWSLVEVAGRRVSVRRVAGPGSTPGQLVVIGRRLDESALTDALVDCRSDGRGPH